MSADMLAQAFASTAGVLAGVDAQQLDAATPCASWQVRELVNHIVGGTTYFAVAAETGQAPAPAETDFCEGDFVSEFNKGAARAVKAFEADGVMDKMMKLPFGELPGGVFINIAAIDTFTHGWDLAKATGQSTDLDPGLATQLLAIAEGFVADDLPRPRRPGALRPQGGGAGGRRLRPTGWRRSSAVSPDRVGRPGRQAVGDAGRVVVRREGPRRFQPGRDGAVERRVELGPADPHPGPHGCIDVGVGRGVDVHAPDDLAAGVGQHRVGEAPCGRRSRRRAPAGRPGCARASSARRARGGPRSRGWRGCARRSSSRHRDRPRCARPRAV